MLVLLGWFPLEVTRRDDAAFLGWWDGADRLVRQAPEAETILRVPPGGMLEQRHQRFAGMRFIPHEYPASFHRPDKRAFRIRGCTGRLPHCLLNTVYPPSAMGSRTGYLKRRSLNWPSELVVRG